jgi:hypothetical protein
MAVRSDNRLVVRSTLQRCDVCSRDSRRLLGSQVLHGTSSQGALESNHRLLPRRIKVWIDFERSNALDEQPVVYIPFPNL